MSITSATAYPLSWPDGWPRTTNRKKARFDMPFGKVTLGVRDQLQLMGATSVVISTNVPLKSNGIPTADFKVSDILDPGVAVYFFYKDRQMVFACDRWKHVEDNMNAVMKTIEAIRGIERWGASEMMERAFRGFAQIEAPSEEWWDILQVSRNATQEEIKAAWRIADKSNHPDAGGSEAAMSRINRAYQKATSNN
jgi:hypothetical protein